MGVKTDFNFLKRRIRDRDSLAKLEKIKKMWHQIRKENKTIRSKKLFTMKLGNYKIWFRENGASSAIDTYLEMFQHKNHLNHPEFTGKKDKVVFDIGANEGYYILKMKENNPKLRIVAVEPVPSTFKILKLNVKSNKLKDVILVNKALTSKKGKISFQIVPEVTVVGGLDIAMQKRPWLDNKRIRKISVESDTLINLCQELKIDHIDILKLDVEGSEYDILKSSSKMLKNIKKIVIEWHGDYQKNACKNFLKKNGFKLVFEEGKICGNLYFINKERKT